MIGDMDKSKLMIYVQKVKEDKLKHRKEFCSKRLTFQLMSLTNRRLEIRICHHFRNVHLDLVHNQEIHVHQITEVISGAKIHTTS